MSPKGEGFYAVDFSHFGLESDIVFEGTTGVYERIFRFISKWMKRKEKCEIEMDFKKSSC